MPLSCIGQYRVIIICYWMPVHVSTFTNHVVYIYIRIIDTNCNLPTVSFEKPHAYISESRLDFKHIPGSGFIVACRLCLVLLKLPAKVLVIKASSVGAPQTGQSQSCTDSCISADSIRTNTISLYITATCRSI